MKILKKLLGAALGVVALSAPIAHAGQVVFNFSNLGVYSGTVPGSPADANTYASATINWVDGSHTATIFMQVFNAGGLAGTAGYVNDWFFNLDPTNQFLSLAYASGTAAKDLFWSTPNQYNADGGGYFDARISFDTKAPGQLGIGNTSTYTVTTLNALAAGTNPFSYPSVHPKGGTVPDPRDIEAAIHIQGYGNSAWIRGCKPGETSCDTGEQSFCDLNPDAPECQPPGAPEPLTLAIFGTGLLGMAITRRRRGKL